MWFMPWIVDRLNGVSGFFYDLYYECYLAGWPLNILRWFFYDLSVNFSDLAQYFSDFGSWVNTVQARVSEILSTWDIWSYFEWWFNTAENAWNWVSNAFWNVWDTVDTWWSSTSTTVLGWIDEAKAWTQLWIDYLQDQVIALGVRIDNVLALIPDISDIQAWFTNWTGNVTSVITTWWTGALSEVQDLINSAFVIRTDFWAGWQDWRDKVTEFFTDPEDWLYKSVDRIVERFW